MQPGQRALAARVADGVRAAGGTPLEFNTIAISDNLTQGTPGMRASLVSRELIADSVELVGLSQPFDGLVCIGGCDKTVPGLAMGLLRLDVPGLILYSGAMAAGSHNGAPVTIQDVWEAVGAHEGGRIDDEELDAARTRRLSRFRRLHRALHGEHDGRRDRLPRARADRPRERPGGGPRQGRRGRGGRRGSSST